MHKNEDTTGHFSDVTLPWASPTQVGAEKGDRCDRDEDTRNADNKRPAMVAQFMANAGTANIRHLTPTLDPLCPVPEFHSYKIRLELFRNSF